MTSLSARMPSYWAPVFVHSSTIDESQLSRDGSVVFVMPAIDTQRAECTLLYLIVKALNVSFDQ